MNEAFTRPWGSVCTCSFATRETREETKGQIKVAKYLT